MTGRHLGGQACILALLLVGVSACGDDNGGTTPGAASSPTVSGSVPTTEAVGEVVHVNGHDIYATCTPGSGPSVVFLHGAGGEGSDWDTTIDHLDGFSPCAYDRFNVGGSGHDEQRHSPVEAAADLEGVLEATGMEPPYILVAHSWGGLLALIEAGRHPEKVAGLVLADGMLPLETSLDPPETVEDVRAEVNGFERGLDGYDAYAEAAPMADNPPDLPMTFIYATKYPDELPSTWPPGAYDHELADWVATWPQGRLVTCDCSHAIPREAPDLIAEQIRAMFDPAR